ncbi:hypothetical protein [Methylovirgula sp. HY1]|uniref:hypothetical protein n=1 Tax=Methylovirgula sp. HY1 TaxID=2822761 RepID=UPI001C740795|nr:hypothetical protein [Methylovirgula sp. HY1]QXX76528.1 hypothetical protein MHY1_p00050 [Methylovirgula sp. HY1]
MTGLELLNFARGPALMVALVVMVFGLFWRIIGILAMRRPLELSRARVPYAWLKGVQAFFSHLWPHKEYRAQVLHWTVISYAFHFGLFVVILGFVPHILFIRSVTGLNWPGLPNGIVALAGFVTLLGLLALLTHRIASPILRGISGFGDYFAWFLVALPLATGLTAFYHLVEPYSMVLAIHVLSVDLLLLCLPFTKLAHTGMIFFSRAMSGAFYGRRGVSI